jgi:predicted metalloendopeptidase
MMIWVFIKSVLALMPDKYGIENFSFLKEFNITYNEIPRSRSCMDFLVEQMEQVISRMYVDRYFNESLRHKVNKCFINKNAMINR